MTIRDRRIARPVGGGCAVQIRVYTGSWKSKLGGCYVHCSRDARPGKHTCWQHAHLEHAAAQLVERNIVGRR